MPNLQKTILAAAVATAFAVTGAAANTLNLTGSGSITCNGAALGACLGIFDGTGSTSTTTAGQFNGNPATAVATAGRLNALAGTSFAGTGGAFDGADRGNALTFTSIAQWLVLRIANDNYFIKNSSGAGVNVTLANVNGLNQIREFGQVPLPAAAWMMLAGIAGLGFARRRRAA